EFRDDARNGLKDRSDEVTIAIDEHKPARSQRRRQYETTAEIDLMAAEVLHSDSRSDVKLQAVLEITRYLRSTLQPDEVLSRIVECVTHIFPHFSRSYLLRHDAATNQLVPVVVKLPAGETESGTALPAITEALARQVL